jgi:uncharacterized protein DUF6527
MTIVPKFIDRVPSTIQEGIIYISASVNTAVHLCPCGCKTEIVTPIDPSEWRFTYDGETISLYPSVGVWGAACKSHYWIKRNQVEWSRIYTDREIEEVRASERKEQLDKTIHSKRTHAWWDFKWLFGK